MSDYFNCPNCGAGVPAKSKSCPECGSDEQTGWSEFTYMDTISTPDQDEYLDLLDNEFSEEKKSNKSWVIATGTLLLLSIIALVIKNMF